MLSFSRGWKRKVGCVTLLVACLFAAIWMKSLSEFSVSAFGSDVFISYGGRIQWIRKTSHWIDDGRPNPYSEMQTIAVPFASIVVPLTLLSAWLLLSKPPRVETTEQTSANGEANE